MRVCPPQADQGSRAARSGADCAAVYPSIHPCIYVSMSSFYVAVYLSIHPSVCPIHPSTHLPLHLPTSPPACLSSSIYGADCLSGFAFVCLCSGCPLRGRSSRFGPSVCARWFAFIYGLFCFYPCVVLLLSAVCFAFVYGFFCL